MTLANNINFYRTMRGFSMETLATKDPVNPICSTKALSLIESGTTKSPGVDIVVGLAKGLCTSINSLILNEPLFIDLEGICRESAGGMQCYIHQSISDWFTNYLNTHHPEREQELSWETITLDEFNESHYVTSEKQALFIGDVCVGYAISDTDWYQGLLNDFKKTCIG